MTKACLPCGYGCGYCSNSYPYCDYCINGALKSDGINCECGESCEVKKNNCGAGCADCHDYPYCNSCFLDATLRSDNISCECPIGSYLNYNQNRCSPCGTGCASCNLSHPLCDECFPGTSIS